MDSPELWQWVWLVAALVFAVGEMTTAGSFFLLPFGIGAAAATALAFAGATLGWQWFAFVGVSAVAFISLRPLARRLDEQIPALLGVGADRWTGRTAVVVEEIPAGPAETGMVRLDREAWRAESADGRPIAAGAQVEVVKVEGTRVVVRPVDQLSEQE